MSSDLFNKFAEKSNILIKKKKSSYFQSKRISVLDKVHMRIYFFILLYNMSTNSV